MTRVAPCCRTLSVMQRSFACDRLGGRGRGPYWDGTACRRVDKNIIVAAIVVDRRHCAPFTRWPVSWSRVVNSNAIQHPCLKHLASCRLAHGWAASVRIGARERNCLLAVPGAAALGRRGEHRSWSAGSTLGNRGATLVDRARKCAARAFTKPNQARIAVIRDAIIISPNTLRCKVVQIFVHDIGARITAGANRVHFGEHVIVSVVGCGIVIADLSGRCCLSPDALRCAR